MDPGRASEPAERAATPPIASSLQEELDRALAAFPAVSALWVGLASGIPLATVGRDADASSWIAERAPRVLGTCRIAPPESDYQVVLAGPSDLVLTLSVDEEVRLLTRMPPRRFRAGDLEELRGVARRVEDRILAWKTRFLSRPAGGRVRADGTPKGGPPGDGPPPGASRP